MAPKRLLEDPPPADSTEDEDSGSEDDAVEEEENGVSEGVEDEEESEADEGEEEEEVDDDRSKKKPTCNNKSTVTPSSKASERHSSSSDSGDETESDSISHSNKTQPSPSASDFAVKPIMSKPFDDSGKPQKIASKRNATPAPATATAGSKRKGEGGEIEGKESKKKKASNGQDDDVKKGSGRVWSEDDEIAILKGMIEYKSKKGADPHADMGVFHEFLKKNLHADVSKNQLMDKVRRLKKKYQINAEKGEDPVFTKPHERKFFKLSRKIWGTASANGVDDNAKNKRKLTQNKIKSSSAIPSPKPKLNGEVNGEPEKTSLNSSFLDGLLSSGKLLSQPEAVTSIMKEALPLIGSSKAEELERKWGKLQEDEFQLYLRRIELVHESAKLLFEAKKSSKF